MAIVKVLFRKNAARVIRYVFGHSQPGDSVDSESCPPHQEGAISEFKMVREQHDFQDGNNQALHIVQSWDENESKKFPPSEFNAMGKKLVEDYFKGHQFVIVTHTDKPHIHNHIVVNTVNMDSGKLVENKYHHLHKLREINDKLCLERGLKIPNQDATLRRERMPEKVKQMVRNNRPSWVWDVKNKADVARFLSTSYDEYTSYLGAFGVQARVEEKNITYFYPGRSRGKRGDTFGKHYDKAGLEEQFKANNERFRARPDIRARLWENATPLRDGSGRTFRDSSGLLLDAGIPNSEVPKDYSRFTKTSRRDHRPLPASERELAYGIFPVEEIKRAKRSILDYCNENKITTGLNTKGQTVLSGKEFIVIDGHQAHNTKNGTHATLIDFVASHHGITLLQAVSKINGNKSLDSFEDTFGTIKRNYTSFYIPKSDQMPHPKARELLSHFLKASGANPKAADNLLKHQRAEVSAKGIIRFFAESDSSGALEYSKGENDVWSVTKQGKFKRPFHKRVPRGSELFVYMEPKSYLARKGAENFFDRVHKDGILALMEPEASHVSHFLSDHEHVKHVQVVKPKGRQLNKAELDFFGVLKDRHEKHGIKLSFIEPEISHKREGPELSM